jgi:hypothetical protein
MRAFTRIAIVALLTSAGCDTGAVRRAEIEKAEAQVGRIAD